MGTIQKQTSSLISFALLQTAVHRYRVKAHGVIVHRSLVFLKGPRFKCTSTRAIFLEQRPRWLGRLLIFNSPQGGPDDPFRSRR